MTMSLCSPQSVCGGGLRGKTVQVLVGLLSLPAAAAAGHRRGGGGSGGGSGQRVAVLLPVNLILLSGSVNTCTSAENNNQ